MERELKSIEQIADEVNRLLRLNRGVQADGDRARAGLPVRFCEADHAGCNWTIDFTVHSERHEAAFHRALANVRARWNVRPEFEFRPSEKSMVLASDIAALKTHLNDGDTATLKLGDVEVLVRDCRVLRDGDLTGRIERFVGCTDQRYRGYAVGEEVSFWPSQVFMSLTHA